MDEEKETAGQTEENQQEGQAGQVQGNQGQSEQAGNQPVEVELSDGTRVSLDELKSGYLKDADYRRKTAEVAEERRRIREEREAITRHRSQALLDAPIRETDDDEGPDPIQILSREIVSVKAALARDYLTREIDRLAAKYPEADKRTVFARCWSNPNAIIEDEMTDSHEAILARVNERAAKVKSPATLDEFLKQNPKAKEDYDRKVLEDHMRKKAMKSTESKTVAGGSSASGETVRETRERPTKYREVSERLKAQLKEEGDESF